MAVPALPSHVSRQGRKYCVITTTKENIMGDKGGKKDKEKMQKQKASKQAVKDKQKQEKQVKKV